MRRVLVVVLVVPAICLAGCGGGSDNAASTKTATTTKQQATDTAAQESAREPLRPTAKRPAPAAPAAPAAASRSRFSPPSASHRRSSSACRGRRQARPARLGGRQRRPAAHRRPREEGLRAHLQVSSVLHPARQVQERGRTPRRALLGQRRLEHCRGPRLPRVKTTRSSSRGRASGPPARATPSRGRRRPGWHDRGCLGSYRDRPPNAPPTGLGCERVGRGVRQLNIPRWASCAGRRFTA